MKGKTEGYVCLTFKSGEILIKENGVGRIVIGNGVKFAKKKFYEKVVKFFKIDLIVLKFHKKSSLENLILKALSHHRRVGSDDTGETTATTTEGHHFNLFKNTHFWFVSK
jgi:hypothetical protein